jgi:D-alanyl-lipoteichoic acid acyltransferase DltB (MBOAT superfamily)
MGFLSAPFLLVFLPISLAGFYLLRRVAPQWCVAFLVSASLVFLALNSAVSLAVILCSVCVNRTCAQGMALHPATRTGFLVTGIMANIAAIAWFKINPVPLGNGGSAMLVAGMPLGLSFYAFKQITYLIDRHQARAPDLSFTNYMFFSVFFAHLPAGPITPYHRLQPQIEALPRRRTAPHDLAAGLALFIIGAFKLRVLSAQISALTMPIYAEAEKGADLCLPEGIVASFGFMLELYYNFSGYSDMAIGLALLVGLRLSPNFDSPLQARRIGDYIMRWHMSFMVFARDYVFAYLQKGLAPFLPVRSNVRRRLLAWAIAISLTYVLVMLWHAASWAAFVISLLTAAIVIAAGLARVRAVARDVEDSLPKRVLGHVLCLVFACVTVVFFRADDLGTAFTVFDGLGALPETLDLFRDAPRTVGICPVLSTRTGDLVLLAIFALAAVFALFGPNSMRLFGILPPRTGGILFRPSSAWAVGLGFLAWLAWLSDAPYAGGVIYEGF